MSNQEADWKEQYLSLSEQHESLQQASEKSQRVFCRALIRLTMSVKGLDQALDPFLSRIHETVKNDCSTDISKKLDDLTDAMIRAADAKSSQDPFEYLLSHISLQDADRKKAVTLWRQISANPLEVKDQDVDSLVLLLGGDLDIENAEPALSKPATGRTGLFSKLFSQNKSGDFQPNLVLRELLEKLKWPNPIEPHIHHLVGQLEDNSSTDMWITVITRVNEIVIDTLSNFQSEVKSAEDFLSELSARLQDFDNFVQGANALRQASLESGRALGKTMTEQVNGIASSMQKAAELEQLKASVGERLDIIQSHVSSHLHTEEERYLQAVQRETELKQKLTSLEDEAQGLKKQILAASSKAVTDAVTGLPNRQAYDERIAQEYSRWKRFAEPLVLMVWDIDDFKKINDRYGHRSGDKALKIIAAKLRGVIRETDFIGRYGGEEFVVLLVGTDTEGAKKVAEKMRQQVEQTAMKANDEQIRMTISGGLSVFSHGDTPDEVFERADQALYKAKRSGKNRFVVA